MKTQTKLLIVLFALIGFAGISHAQTVEQVASEVDQVEVDLVTVNSKADNAKTKADQNEAKTLGVEQRVTALEARPTVDPLIDSRVVTLESDHAVAMPRLSTVESKVAALEANPGGVSFAEHDALAARVTALESPTTGGVFALYDSSGAHLGDWQSRVDFGRALINVGGFQVWAQFDRDAISYLGLVEPMSLHFLDKFCTRPFVKVSEFVPLVERSTEFFGGKIHSTIINGEAHRLVETVVSQPGQMETYFLDFRRRCDTGPGMSQTDVFLFENLGPLPTFYPPFSMVQE